MLDPSVGLQRREVPIERGHELEVPHAHREVHVQLIDVHRQQCARARLVRALGILRDLIELRALVPSRRRSPLQGDAHALRTLEQRVRSSDLGGVRHGVISEREHREIEAANASSTTTPVVFIHGLWVLPSSWANWADFFEQAGYVSLTPDWPDDPATVEEALGEPGRPRQEDLAAGRRSHDRDHQCLGQETSSDGALDRRPAGADGRRPAPLGSNGGHRPRALPGRPAAARLGAQGGGPGSSLVASPRGRAITLTFEQFKYGWANACSTRRRRRSCTTRSTSPAPGSCSGADGQRQPQPVDRGEGQHEEPRPRSPADHRGREGPHGAVGDGECRLQATEAQPRRHRDREDAEPRPRPHDRPRLARGRPDGGSTSSSGSHRSQTAGTALPCLLRVRGCRAGHLRPHTVGRPGTSLAPSGARASVTTPKMTISARPVARSMEPASCPAKQGAIRLAPSGRGGGIRTRELLLLPKQLKGAARRLVTRR